MQGRLVEGGKSREVLPKSAASLTKMSFTFYEDAEDSSGPRDNDPALELTARFSYGKSASIKDNEMEQTWC